MRICGSVENVIFFNPENGYCVFEVDDGKGLPIVMVGNFLQLTEGMQVDAEGEFKTSKYGEQFNITSIKIMPPKTLDGITRYLASGLIKGVGEVTASAIVTKFKEDTMDVLEFNPSRLADIKGISLKKAIAIGEGAAKLKSMQQEVMFLQKHNISVNMAIKIYNVYKERTQEILIKNPYRLVEDVDGIGFITADKIAQNLGVELDSDFRLRAGLIYALKENCVHLGSTYIMRQDLIEKTMSLLTLEVSTEKINNIIDNLIYDNVFCIFKTDEIEGLCLKEYYKTERSIAVKLLKLEKEFDPVNIDFENEIKTYEAQNSIELHDDQKQAVKSALSHGVSVITGGPGTGKTTIIKTVIYLLKKHGVSTVLCAPTGRAAKRLTESTGMEAKTIHRLLDIDFKNGTGVFTYNETTRLDYKAIICDEVSMVDVSLMNNLVKAINGGARFIIVGDKDQLPSVGSGNVLSDIIDSKAFSVSILNKIFRQSESSHIIVNAHRINEGHMPVVAGKKSDFFLMNESEQEKILEIIKELYTQRLPKYLSTDCKNIQILAPLKKGILGVENLNKVIQDLVNKSRYDKLEYSGVNYVFRTGDKVMQTVNNYQLEWLKSNELGLGVFNGDIGTIESITKLGEVTVLFEDGRTVVYDRSDVSDLTLAYAISVHKSQGSEFDAVILPVINGHQRLFTRNLLYTAVTRAKKLVVLIGANYSIKRMVINNYTEKRFTMLLHFLNTLDIEI